MWVTPETTPKIRENQPGEVITQKKDKKKKQTKSGSTWSIISKKTQLWGIGKRRKKRCRTAGRALIGDVGRDRVGVSLVRLGSTRLRNYITSKPRGERERRKWHLIVVTVNCRENVGRRGGRGVLVRGAASIRSIEN